MQFAFPLRLFCLILTAGLAGCGREAPPTPRTEPPKTAAAAPAPQAEQPPTDRYERLRWLMRNQKASLADVDEALTENDAMGLANSVLHLYFLREQPGVTGLLQELWSDDEQRHPGANWTALRTTALRVATAHILARSNRSGSGPYLAFIRGAVHDPDEFAQAQAAAALGFLGDDSDVPALSEMASRASAYASEAAIKSLAIRGGDAAHQALLQLQEQYRDDARKSTIINRMLADHFPRPP